jgi:hypothetical protein
MFVAPAVAGITVTPTGDPNTLANSIAGPGINITSSSFSGAAAAAGTFTGGAAAGLGINSGIVLTTGSALFAGEQNTFDDRTRNNGAAGSPILDALVPGFSTRDATLLTLTFTTTGGDLFFHYSFGSEEYNEFVGSDFNDVFGFFLDGTAVTDNIALIPSTSTPVSINTVNLGSNPAFFRDNDAGNAGNSVSGNQRPVDPADATFPDLQYDGLTTVLTASALGLAPGEHTIVLAIGDAVDGSLDSGVYIQAGSFSDQPQPPDVPDGGSTLLLLTLALGSLARLGRKA